jgi:hypothetical protein
MVVVIKLFIAFVVIVIGLRTAGMGIYTFFTGKVLVRDGVKTKWINAPSDTDFLKILARDVLMGGLLVVLGVVLII